MQKRDIQRLSKKTSKAFAAVGECTTRWVVFFSAAAEALGSDPVKGESAAGEEPFWMLDTGFVDGKHRVYWAQSTGHLYWQVSPVARGVVSVLDLGSGKGKEVLFRILQGAELREFAMRVRPRHGRRRSPGKGRPRAVRSKKK